MKNFAINAECTPTDNTSKFERLTYLTISTHFTTVFVLYILSLCMFCKNCIFNNATATYLKFRLTICLIEYLCDCGWAVSQSHCCTHRVHAKQTELHLCTLMMQGFKSLALEFSVWCCLRVWVAHGRLWFCELAGECHEKEWRRKIIRDSVC